MRKLFLIWCLLYPLVVEIVNYLVFLQERTYNETVEVWALLINLIFYLFIATLLWKNDD